MAKFLFVSFKQPGHMDFGGLSFLRLAQHLAKQGHQVRWVFSFSELQDYSNLVHDLLKKYQIDFDHTRKFYLTFDHHQKDIRQSTENLEQYILAKKYDCLVVDRLCVGGAFAASAAGIPWATIGTDGREWSRRRSHVTGGFTVIPEPYTYNKFPLPPKRHYKVAAPEPSRKSYWATSPFLNLSFFPRRYYERKFGNEVPPHSHFLGCGPIPAVQNKGTSLLITFGNSFYPILRKKIVKILKSDIRRRGVQTLFLTGSESLTRAVANEFSNIPRVTIKNWMPYDQAFQQASLVIGHGGTAHIWYGLREGVPLLVIPFVGDQCFGGLQVERLNVGRTVSPRKMPWLLPGPFKVITDRLPPGFRIRISRRECIDKLNELFEEEGIRESCFRMRLEMRNGGGVAGGSSLLERLAQDRMPITSCATPKCCC